MATDTRPAGIPTAMAAALEALLDAPLPDTTKGIPVDGQITARSIGERGWSIAAGDLPMPVLTLDMAAVDHNIDLVQSYADDQAVLLAPHGKTTMAPQIWARQLARGAWAITLGTPHQLQIARAFGLSRVIYANEPTTAYEYKLLADQLRAGLEVYALVDDPDAARRLGRGVEAAGANRPLPVLVELGITRGRTGLRSREGAIALGRLVAAGIPGLRLAGVECFEGTASLVDPANPLQAVDAMLADLAEVAIALLSSIPVDAQFLISAGGSGFFDRVVEVVAPRVPAACRIVLRPGTYVTHDDGAYDSISPLGRGPGRRLALGELRPALTLWAAVLSRPEENLAILNAGRRDSPADAEAPTPRWHVPVNRDIQSAGGPLPFPGHATVFAANDQHMYLRNRPDVAPGGG